MSASRITQERSKEGSVKKSTDITAATSCVEKNSDVIND